MIAISIIVPMYNVEKYIETCIESLLRQSISKEIILIDDGSLDKTFEIAQKYEKNNSCITLLHQKNSGQSAARNRGIEIASGEYVLFCDSDDCIDTESLPDMYRLCKKNNLDFLKTGWKTQSLGETKFNIPPENKIPLNCVITAREYFCSSIYNWYNVVPWNGLFKLNYLKKHGILFSEGIQFEDNLYHLTVITADLNARVMQIAKPFYTVHISEGSTTTAKPNPKKIYDQLENIRLMKALIENSINDSEIKKLSMVAVSSLVFTMTSYYYRVENIFREELDAAIPRVVLKEAIAYPQSNFQKNKLIAFTYFRPLLNIYEHFRMRRTRNV